MPPCLDQHNIAALDFQGKLLARWHVFGTEDGGRTDDPTNAMPPGRRGTVWMPASSGRTPRPGRFGRMRRPDVGRRRIGTLRSASCGPACSDNALDIGPGGVVALERQRLAGRLGERIGEAVVEVQARLVPPFAEAPAGIEGEFDMLGCRNPRSGSPLVPSGCGSRRKPVARANETAAGAIRDRRTASRSPAR